MQNDCRAVFLRYDEDNDFGKEGGESAMKKDIHCCATCVNFKASRTDNGMKYECVRLGFDTQPSYKFNCWDPKEHVKKWLEK